MKSLEKYFCCFVWNGILIVNPRWLTAILAKSLSDIQNTKFYTLFIQNYCDQWLPSLPLAHYLKFLDVLSIVQHHISWSQTFATILIEQWVLRLMAPFDRLINQLVLNKQVEINRVQFARSIVLNKAVYINTILYIQFTTFKNINIFLFILDLTLFKLLY